MTTLTVVWMVLAWSPFLVTGDSCPNGKDTLLTYNAALTPTIPGFKERRQRLPGIIAAEASNADFMCFQELWYEEDVRRVLEAVEDEFPYHYSYLHFGISNMTGHTEQKDPPCGKWKIVKLSSCMSFNCFNAADQLACMTTHCQSYLTDMSNDCLACIAVSSTSFSEVMTQCMFSWWGSNNRFNSPGVVVASRRPMTAAYVSYTPPKTKTFLARGYIKVQVQNGPPIVCTHLSSISFSTYYEVKMPYSSYEEQQRGEIGIIKDRFSGSAHVLLGDLNSGPARNGSGDLNLEGEATNNYELLMSSVGYTAPYLASDGRCTFCENNLVIREGGLSGNKLIDHILTKGLKSDASSAQRVFDDPADGPLSDHYGVRVDVCRA